MANLVIREELQKLLPSLSTTEYAGLEADIIAHGCISPLVVWSDILVDGHHRYRICQTHGIPFETKPLEFASLEEAMFWAWTHQENRRNLQTYQRVKIALQFKPVLAGKVKIKESERKMTLENSTKSPEINTRTELAKIAGVSDNTVARVEYLEKHADDVTKQKLCNGETTINKEYNRLKKQDTKPKCSSSQQVDQPLASETTEEKNDEVTFGLYLRPGEKSCAETCEPYVPRTTLKNIPQDNPDLLLANLEAHFRNGFIEDLVLCALEFLRREKGKKITDAMIRDLTKRLKN